jgi:hypothetical protein
MLQGTTAQRAADCFAACVDMQQSDLQGGAPGADTVERLTQLWLDALLRLLCDLPERLHRTLCCRLRRPHSVVRVPRPWLGTLPHCILPGFLHRIRQLLALCQRRLLISLEASVQLALHDVEDKDVTSLAQIGFGNGRTCAAAARSCCCTSPRARPLVNELRAHEHQCR